MRCRRSVRSPDPAMPFVAPAGASWSSVFGTPVYHPDMKPLHGSLAAVANRIGWNAWTSAASTAAASGPANPSAPSCARRGLADGVPVLREQPLAVHDGSCRGMVTPALTKRQAPVVRSLARDAAPHARTLSDILHLRCPPFAPAAACLPCAEGFQAAATRSPTPLSRGGSDDCRSGRPRPPDPRASRCRRDFRTRLPRSCAGSAA
jgi:hypothetical protein